MTQEEKRVLTVAEITRLIKFRLENLFPRVWIEGEVSNFKQHTSGHLYFTLKDENAQISAVMWRSKAETLLFLPEDGMKLIVRGAITVYPPRGNYQIEVDQIQPVGVGQLQLAFERLKQKLAAEGLFDPRRKRPVPEFPERIGIITSPTGAALQDLKNILRRRFPSVEIVFCPVSVQGVGAAEEIARAIKDMNGHADVEVLIVGRGGGSLEDLWAFNEEVVARAIYDSEVPVISAVGHEIDFTIADFVADLRAPTPSAAAELAVPDRSELLDILRNMCYTMRRKLDERVASFRERVDSLVSSYSFNLPRNLLRELSQRIDELEHALDQELAHFFQLMNHRQETFGQRLEALGPQNVLRRGYTMIRKEGRVVMSSALLHEGDRAIVQFHDGDVPARVEPKE